MAVDYTGLSEALLAERMAVIVPTRERPHLALRLVKAWLETEAQATLVLSYDEDDPHYSLYEGINGDRVEHFPLPRTTMNGSLNAAAVAYATRFDFLGFMGDDHLPRTGHWDRRIAWQLRRPGAIAYGNDLFQGPNLPTAVFMDARIVATLGYMAPPKLRHLFLDNAWKTWGEYLHTLVYLPDVVIEHMHPQAGKAEWDDGHKRVNSGEVWDHDREVWGDYVYNRLDHDCAKLARLASGAAA